MDSIGGYLDRCFNACFAPLISGLSLDGVTRNVSGMGGAYEARGENAAIRLVNDRGIVNFDVYSIAFPKSCWCDVELLSELLDPPESKFTGIRRLDLQHQADFLLERWGKIEILMAPESAKTTKKQLNQLGVARSRKLFPKRSPSQAEHGEGGKASPATS